MTNGISRAKQEQGEPKICVTAQEVFCLQFGCVKDVVDVSGVVEGGNGACLSLQGDLLKSHPVCDGPHLEARKRLFIDRCLTV